VTTGRERVSVCLAGLVVGCLTCTRKVSGSDRQEGINCLIPNCGHL
jgi:hypothetical protein